MQFAQKRVVRLAALVGLAGVIACENQLPTLTGDGAFPVDRIPVTIELSVPSEQVIGSHAVYDGFDTRLEYLLVAREFEGALTSHAIARFTGFPDTIRYSSAGTVRTETDFAYVGAQVTAIVDTLSSLRQPTRMELHPVTQFWDTLAVTWQNAVHRPGASVPWNQPGGTVGPAVSGTEWTGGAGETDSVRFQLDSLTVRRLASGELHGVQIRATESGRRVELSRLGLEVSIRPAGQPDTVLSYLVFGGRQTFVLTPEPPQPPNLLRIGGLTGARSTLQLNLDLQVPTCPPPQTGPGCAMVPLREVTLDRASLMLRSVPVAAGFRPLTPALLQTRRLLEPELGRRSPVGGLLESQNIPADRFAAGGTASEVAVDLTRWIGPAAATAPYSLPVMLVSAIGSNDFGTAWFEPAPTLRLIYTVPRPPLLP